MNTLVHLRCVYGFSLPCTCEIWERLWAEALPSCESLAFKRDARPARLIASSIDLPTDTIRLTYRFQAPNSADAGVIAEHLRSLGFSQVFA